MPISSSDWLEVSLRTASLIPDSVIVPAKP